MSDYLSLAAVVLFIILVSFGLRRALAALGAGPKLAIAISAALARVAIVGLIAFFTAMRNP